MSIRFTQYLRPHGRPVDAFIDRPEAIERKAERLRNHGYTFEIEQLRTGDISMSVTGEDGDVAGRICPNGPKVPDMVDAMIEEASTLVGHE